MTAFENKDYEIEAKQRWGHTDAYQESVEKAAGSAEEQVAVAAGLMAIFGEFAACKAAGEAVDGEAAQAIAKKLQEYISAHFYTCTTPILAGLGQMYVGDERFRANIDSYGEGTAAFAAAVIESYCER